MSAPVAPTLEWVGEAEGHLRLLDQTLLPLEARTIVCRDVEAVFEAIRSLRVRGAPAIGIAAAYGVCLGMQRAGEEPAAIQAHLEQALRRLGESRPTAVNLFWALDRMRKAAQTRPALTRRELAERLLAEARAIHEEDRAACRAIGRFGAALMVGGQGVLTHCNAGGLATSEYGTALAVFFAAHEAGKRLHVYVDETRPLLQGARLTAWELLQRGIDVTLICDSMAAHVMREGKVQAVVTGADRIAANGDTANKIGTYGLALAAAAHRIPFYVAAPASTFDLRLAGGDQIPIEQRAPEEITRGFGRQTAPHGVRVYNPAFDVTPAALITAVICEHGIIQPVTRETIARVLARNEYPRG
jgi:methylthioribose-1-phosphate isomerase